MEGEEAEARRRPVGSSSPCCWRPGKGPWGLGWAVTGPAAGGVGAATRGLAGRPKGGDGGAGPCRPPPRRPQGPGSISSAPEVASSASCFSYDFGSAEGSGRLKGYRPELECATCEAWGGRPRETCWREPRFRTPFPRGFRCRWSPRLFPPTLLGLVAPGLPLWCGESGEIEAGAPAGRCRPRSPWAPSDRQLNR